MMCATSLFSVSMWALFPGQRVQTAGCTQVNVLHPQTSLFLELYQSGDSCGIMEPETGHLSKDQTSITMWMHPCCTHQLDCELKQRGREDVACSRAEPCASWSMRLILALLPAQIQLCATSTQTTILDYRLTLKQQTSGVLQHTCSLFSKA